MTAIFALVLSHGSTGYAILANVVQMLTCLDDGSSVSVRQKCNTDGTCECSPPGSVGTPANRGAICADVE